MHHVTKDYATEKGVPITLHENKIFTVFFNGYYHYLEFHTFGGGAIAIPRFSNGDLLLVNLRRAPAFGFSLEFPRGGVEKGEQPKFGVLRELAEETGFNAADCKSRYFGQLAPDTATINGASHVYLIDLPDNLVQGEYDHLEIDKPVRVPSAEMRDMVRNNIIVDGQTLGAYAMLLVS